MSSTEVSRRGFLGGLLGLGAASVLPMSEACATDAFWLQPRRLDLWRPALNRRVQTVYWANGAYLPEAYRELCWLMQDHRAEQAYPMDLRLLDLVCAMQAWVNHFGYREPIQITSGYRTPQSNSRLEGAARHSMHLQGKALDLVFPGLPVSYVGQLAAHYAGGGVGFYPDSGFVHVDTGRQRYWGRGSQGLSPPRTGS